MIFGHISDLHIGKSVCHHSLLEDQRYILEQIVHICMAKHVDALLIAGDVYDRAVPSEQAAALLDFFLSRLSQAGIQVFMIAGDRDSGVRLAFAAGLLDRQNVHIAGVWNGRLTSTELRDDYGTVRVWSLPYFRRHEIDTGTPGVVYPDMTTAMRHVLSRSPINYFGRNVLLTHCFVEGAEIGRGFFEDGEPPLKEQVDPAVFDRFDYVALGHLHAAQAFRSGTIRYSGSPMHYAFGERDPIKKVTLFSLQEKGTFRISTVPLKPLHKMEVVQDSFQSFLRAASVDAHGDSWLRIVLTDSRRIPDAMVRLKKHYPRLLQVVYEKDLEAETDGLKDSFPRSPEVLFADFFQQRSGRKMRPEEEAAARDLMKQVWKEGEK
jgi:exonuclease SbcD